MPNEETEELTETERALLVAYARWAGKASGTTSGSAAAKLLRIHDRLQAERRELLAMVVGNGVGRLAAEIAKGFGATNEDLERALEKHDEALHDEALRKAGR
jgi:hypothetical protein